MGEGSLSFVPKTLDYAYNNASFVPVYLDLPELKVDIDAVLLLGFERPLGQVAQNLDDTIMLSGSEAMLLPEVVIYINYGMMPTGTVDATAKVGWGIQVLLWFFVFFGNQ